MNITVNTFINEKVKGLDFIKNVIFDPCSSLHYDDGSYWLHLKLDEDKETLTDADGYIHADITVCTDYDMSTENTDFWNAIAELKKVDVTFSEEDSIDEFYDKYDALNFEWEDFEQNNFFEEDRKAICEDLYERVLSKLKLRI